MKSLKLSFTLLLSLAIYTQAHSASSKLHGKVIDKKTGEPLIGVSIALLDKSIGTTTNAQGEFSLTAQLPATLEFSYVGYELQRKHIVQQGEALQIELLEKPAQIKETIVSAKAQTFVPSMSNAIRLDPKDTRFLTAAGGERDPLQALSLMPGIKKSANGGEGFFVRGGSPDQNLITLDQATIYNPNHLLGFISAFNPETVSEISMYKGYSPAAFGGRLASVMNIGIKEGSMTQWEGTGALSLLSARIFAAGPLLKNKLSLSVGGRHSFISEVFQMVGNPFPYTFNDLSVKLDYRPASGHRVTYTQFNGQDALEYAPGTKENNQVDFGTRVRNGIYVINYKGIKTNSIWNVNLSATRFNYLVKAGMGNNIFGLKSKINDLQLKTDYTKSFQKNASIKTGIEITHHHFEPNKTSVYGSVSELLKEYQSQAYTSREAAAYIQCDYSFGPRWNLQSGIRISSSFGKGFFYSAPEPRANLRYHIRANQSLSMAISRMSQYMHLVSGSSAVMPTDLWFPVSDKVRPQTADQISFSYQLEMKKIQSVLSIEPYYKSMRNLVEYKEGTQILLNNEIEKDLIQGKGRAYGIELMLQRKSGKWNGWISYTYSITERKFEALNQGEWFFARYDRRHDLNLVANYSFNDKLVLSGTFVLSSGMRVTPVIGKYAMPTGSYNEIVSIPVYGPRNSLVLSPLHRVDLNLTYKAGQYKNMFWEWNIGAYNLYNRTQAYKLSIQQNTNGQLEFKQVGLYGFIPSLGCSIKF